MKDLPAWVWDVLADLVEQEDVHPKLYFTSGAFEGYQQYDWCPKVVLDKVPAEVRDAAAAVAAYRRGSDLPIDVIEETKPAWT